MPKRRTAERVALGQAFAIRELAAALAWASSHPCSDARIVVAADDPTTPEVLEVYRPQARNPNWFITKLLDARVEVAALHCNLLGARTVECAKFDSLHEALEAVSVQLIEGA